MHFSTPIVADHRERGSGVLEMLEGDPDVQLAVRTLRVGDYLVANAVLVERKTVADFARSIVDGRLFRQATRLAAQARPAVIVIEGATPAAAEIEGVDRRAFLGALVSLTTVFRLPVLHAADAAETADLLRYAAGQLSRATAHAVARPGYRPKGRVRRQLFILQGLPGVGPGRAARLLECFGSVERVMTASLERLEEVPGVGRRTAEAIREAVR